jgi:cap2 methyltransferase
MGDLAQCLRQREKFEFRQLPKSVTNREGDFEDLEGYYTKFDEQKRRLVQVQKKLSSLEIVKWHEVTNKLHPASALLKHIRLTASAPLLTQAWLKFYEILSNFESLVCFKSGGFRSLHLCEAPGAFVSALVQFCDGGGIPSPDWTGMFLIP